MVTREQFINGLISYADDEIIPQLPSPGKWVFGVWIHLASDKINATVNSLKDNPMIKPLDIFDEVGNVDSTRLLEAMCISANKYGKVQISVPVIGTLTFSEADVERLRSYI